MKEWIFSEKGIRQGYLLSPQLFNTVMEVVVGAIRQYKKMERIYNERKK